MLRGVGGDAGGITNGDGMAAGSERRSRGVPFLLRVWSVTIRKGTDGIWSKGVLLRP